MTTAPVVSAVEAEAAFVAAQKVVETHRRVSRWLRPGHTLPQIDQFIARTLDTLSCRSCFLGYRVGKGPSFPSHACLSVNECVVHGTAGYYEKPLAPGDALKIDVGVTFRGWIGDAAWTYLFAPVDPRVRALAEAGKESLRRGVLELRPGNPLVSWARVVQGHVEGECGFHLIRGLGGHGYGRTLHHAPFVSNTVPQGPWEWSEATLPCRPGMLLAVEPMLALGTGKTRQRSREWPVFTADGSISAHYEHDVLVTDDGPRILTEGLDELADEITP